ncbi:recombinase family protein [Pseudarthrobacter quantipunctorum]|uniref:recombinase family protein n=1 Tax=Pseudarthrobacter quantipunctorum TaxID=3128980 RepID=UPI00387336B4
MGYDRVRTGEQSADPQTSALREAGCDRIFTDHDVKGPRIAGLELNIVLDHLRSGDELVIWKLDRLSRSTACLRCQDTRHCQQPLDSLRQSSAPAIKPSRHKCGQCPHPPWQDKPCTRCPLDVEEEPPQEQFRPKCCDVMSSPLPRTMNECWPPRPTRQNRNEDPNKPSHSRRKAHQPGPSPPPTHVNRLSGSPATARKASVRGSPPQAMSKR